MTEPDVRRFRSYSRYRDSQLEWIDRIPAHWTVKPNGRLFRERDERGFPELPLLNVSINTGVAVREFSDERIEQKAEDPSIYKRAKKGDLVFNKMRMWQGAVGVAPVDGLVSPDYTVAKPVDGVEPRFFELLFRIPTYLVEIDRHSHGIVKDRNRLYWDDFKQIKSVFPDRKEQEEIVLSVDRETSKIDALIAKKERLIELLQEKRAALIASNLDCTFDSRRVKLGYYIDLLPGFAFQSSGFSLEDNDIRLLRGVNVNPGCVRWDDTVRWPRTEAPLFYQYQLRAGDLVLGMDRPWISSGIRVAEITEADLPCLLLQRVARIRAKTGLRQSYLMLTLQSPQFLAYFEPILTGVSVPHISPDQICNFQFPLPNLELQDTIARSLQTEFKKIEALSETMRASIARLQEFRTALISAAVTGKIDVREEAA